MKIKQVLEALERFAPLPLQESWDNAGLQIGLTEAEVSGALLCLDVTESVVDEAIRRGCNLIVSHHPLLFRGLKQVADMNDVQRTVRRAIKEDICVVSMHTNLDNAQDGVNFKIAERLGQTCPQTPPPAPPRKERGEAPPLTPSQKERGIVGMGDEQKPGQWVMLTLEAPMESRTFVEYVKDRMEAQCAMCNGLMHRPIQKVAICGGAGDFLLDDVIAAGADAFVTGEMNYHQYFGHEQEIQICVIGHYESEHFTTEVLRDVIERECPGVRCCIAETNTNPIRWV